MEQKRKRILAAVVIVLALSVAYLGGYWTARMHYSAMMSEVYHSIREGRPAEDIYH